MFNNMKKIIRVLLLISYILAFYSSAFFKHLIGMTYYSGVFIGVLSSWGFYNLVVKEDPSDEINKDS